MPGAPVNHEDTGPGEVRLGIEAFALERSDMDANLR